MRTTLRSAALLLLVAAALLVHAAAAAEHRPKIGLALSGGGALGMAHIGALKALEELQIPVDYIAGTSMGSLVGGLYASGMSPAEMDEWFRNADWPFLLSDSEPRESESFRSKQRQLDMNKGFAMKVSRKGELKLPRGLLVGRNVIASLRQLTVQVHGEQDFARLPIPFRAVATNLVTGELVVLKRGDLVHSMRASMSIPGLFTPYGIDGKLLVDGGLTKNFPISEVQEMGAEVVIAIDASEQLKDEAHLDTAAAMSNQGLTILVRKQMAAEIARLGPQDTLVTLKIDDMDTTDFMKAAKAIDAGYEATMAQRAKLMRYSSAPAFKAHLARQRHAPGAPVMVSFVQVRTPEGEHEHELGRPVPFDVKSEESFAHVQTRIGDAPELQKFEVGDYQVIEKDGRRGLLVDAHQKKVGPHYLSFGLRYTYSTTDTTDFGILLSYRMADLNRLGGEFETYLSLGDSTRISAELYQPLTSQRRLFVAPNGLFGSDFFEGRKAEGDRVSFRRQDLLGGLDVGTRLWQAGEVRLGYLGGAGRVSRRLGVDDDVPTKIDRGWLHADFTLDTLDDPSFATRGIYSRLYLVTSREELGATDNYTRLAGQAYKPLTFGKNTFVPRVAGSVKLDGRVPIYDQIPLGGFLNLSGYSKGYVFGENSALAEVVYYRRIRELTPGLVPAIYAGASLEAGEVWAGDQKFRLGDATLAGSVFLGAETLAGAFVLGLGVAEGGHTAVYLQLGPLFNQGKNERQPLR
jgi:NTE family protein